MSWQDKERERYEGKLRDSFTIDGVKKDEVGLKVMQDIGNRLCTPAFCNKHVYGTNHQVKYWDSKPTAVVFKENNNDT